MPRNDDRHDLYIWRKAVKLKEKRDRAKAAQAKRESLLKAEVKPRSEPYEWKPPERSLLLIGNRLRTFESFAPSGEAKIVSETTPAVKNSL